VNKTNQLRDESPHYKLEANFGGKKCVWKWKGTRLCT